MSDQRLKRELGLGGAVLTGLGSILGTGAFVSIGLASSQWGDVVILAIPLAGLVAVFNGLSSAFLAGRYPVAGGTYEYAYETLNPWLGFSAGWLFLLAKTTSAATAALGLALYLGTTSRWVPITAVSVVTLLVLLGIRRTTTVNLVLVTVTVVAIVWFAVNGVAGVVMWSGDDSPTAVLAAIAFLFVAYTGYGRVATLGEEVRDPARTIPKAVVISLAVAVVLYLGIELGGRAAGGARWGALLTLGFLDDPLVRVGALGAMSGVLLNLILGLSRVWLAMGRRRDMPSALARLDGRSQPKWAIAVSGILVAATTLIGDLALAWSFSAMTVLLYYGITNLSALVIDRARITSWLGLGSCLSLSFFVPPQVWVVGAALVALGLVWKTATRRLA